VKEVWHDLYMDLEGLDSELEYGGLLEVDGVMFVMGLRVNFLSVSSLEDVGYCTLFRRGHVFIYREGENRLYKV
jgi:hypothetical protein